MKHLLSIGALAAVLGNAALSQNTSSQDAAARTAKLILLDGTTRTVELRGVGCSTTMCSRTVIKSKSGHGTAQDTSLDQVAAIRETSGGGALFVMKDGTSRRLSVVQDNRVLYFNDVKVELGKIKELQIQ